MKFFSFLGPLSINFMRNPQLKDVMLGVIHSKVEQVVPPVGVPRDCLDEQIYAMSAYSFLTEIHSIPAFQRQAEMLDVLGNTTPGLIGRNERIIRQSVTNEPFELKNMFDVINIDETFHTLYSYDSYDLNKINSTSVLFRAGFVQEGYEEQGKKVSLNLAPVLSTNEKIFGSPYGWFNKAPVDYTTREILTVVFGVGMTMKDYQEFGNHLLALKKRQEKEAKTTTQSVQLITGYPSIYSNDLSKPPLIVCEKSIDNRCDNQFRF